MTSERADVPAEGAKQHTPQSRVVKTTTTANREYDDAGNMTSLVEEVITTESFE